MKEENTGKMHKAKPVSDVLIGNQSVDSTKRNEVEKKYWIYAPGRKSVKWDEFYEKGIMGIGWDEMGDISEYPSKAAMKAKMKELYGSELSYMNSAHATWQFANDIQLGDVIYVKKGLYKIVGRGVVESGYYYDEEQEEYKSLRKVKWTDYGEWEHPGQAAQKTLTEITAYTDYVRKLERLFLEEFDEEKDIEEEEVVYEQYTELDFLRDVFMAPKDYGALVNLLKIKRNIILQGAPGVGKTYAAKRLAYSMMGEKNTSRVLLVQFHQSYSYEDFIMGYRPSESGFELTPGPFYEFCKKAEEDIENSYFFIIDEINRGNMSKIFGELLMLIEADKRTEKLRLLYSNEQFTVPENLHIIGMMNTADRSLALIDYALRRRFAFFTMKPAFDSEGFQRLLDESNHPKHRKIVRMVSVLNSQIAADEGLGEGFKVGHSYLCPKEKVTSDWLQSVVEYEIIPLLEEYWFDEPDKVENWRNRLHEALE